MCEYQPLVDMEQLWEQRSEEGKQESEDLPPLEWVEEMTECLRVLVEYGDQDAAYGTAEHAWNNYEMTEFIDSAPGTHPTWLAFKNWAKEVLAEE